MKISIDDACTACGLCCDTCPEVFDMGDVIAEILTEDIDADLVPSVEQAAEECPVAAISLDDS